MEDLDLMMILDDLCDKAEADPAKMPAIADIIFLIRDEEDKTFAEVLDMFNGDLVGRLHPLCEKGLITKKFLKVIGIQKKTEKKAKLKNKYRQ